MSIDGSELILSVTGYNSSEMANANKLNRNYGGAFSSDYPGLINNMYLFFRDDIFRELREYMHFCSVIYDDNKNLMLAGVTESNSQYTHLYYGYTKQKDELIFSNTESVLKNFCDGIIEMQKNTYIKSENEGKLVKKKRL